MNLLSKFSFCLLLLILCFTSCKEKDSGDIVIEGNGSSLQSTVYLKEFTYLVVNDNFNVTIVESDSAIYNITFDAESNLIPYIEYHIDNSVLTLQIESGYELHNSIPINILIGTTKDLDMTFYESSVLIIDYIDRPNDYTISMLNSSKATLKNIHCNNFNISLSGSSLMNIDNFYTSELTINTFTTSKLTMSDIEVDKIYLASNSAGDCYFSGKSNESNFILKSSGAIIAANTTFVEGEDLISDKCSVSVEASGSVYVNVISSLDGKITGSGDVYYRGDIEPAVKITGTGKLIKL